MTTAKMKDVFLHVECAANVAEEQVGAMAAIFRAIAKLTDDSLIKSLCEHGALQGDLAWNDLGVLAEAAENGFPKLLQEAANA
jgi:hypothetical protein